jgi:membrane-bound lytic murein transglycosylase MltF
VPLAVKAGRSAGASTAYTACLGIRVYDERIQASVKRWWPDYPLWLEWRAQLCQESRLDPRAISPVGAAGLAQFMPGTWADVSRQLGYGDVSPHVARYAIEAGAYYMASLRRQWSSPRPDSDRQTLAQASYNTGMGNVLRAQKLCRGARRWPEISACLSLVTGRDAQQTIDYVRLIAWRRHLMEEALR